MATRNVHYVAIMGWLYKLTRAQYKALLRHITNGVSAGEAIEYLPHGGNHYALGRVDNITDIDVDSASQMLEDLD